MMLSYHLILCCSLLLLPSIFPSLRIFSNELTLHIRWPKYWSFSFSISLSNENSGWFPLGLTDLTSLQSKGLSSVCFSTIVQKHNTKKKLVRSEFGIVKCHALEICPEKAMAPHSSTLAWKIPWTEEPGKLQSMGLLRVGHDWATSLSLFTFHFHALEKEMATHSSVLAWRVPVTAEPRGLPSMGSHRVGHD